ncbi:hypothetical protein JCM5353_002089, partial [Sporobolomyces roseus]
RTIEDVRKARQEKLEEEAADDERRKLAAEADELGSSSSSSSSESETTARQSLTPRTEKRRAIQATFEAEQQAGIKWNTNERRSSQNWLGGSQTEHGDQTVRRITSPKLSTECLSVLS